MAGCAFAVLSVLSACADTRDSVVRDSEAHHAGVRGSVALRADTQRLEQDVYWLADDARAGRRAGTPGEQQSAEWIAARFKELGLEPAGDGGWFQRFSVPLEARNGGESHVRWLRADGGDRQARSADEVVPLYCTERGDARGPLVYCGYGIEAADADWDDFAGKPLAGAIALVVRGVPPEPAAADAPAQPAGASPHDTHMAPQGGRFGAHASIFTKIMNAKRHGAIGVVLAPAPDQNALLEFDAGHGARAGIPALMVSKAVADDLLGMDYASALAGPSTQPAGVAREVTLFADVVREKGTATNVLAKLPGVDRSRTVVIGAHFDHLGLGGSGSLAPAEHAVHNGADDNASGTAVLLEIARLMRAGEPPACDVLFALWSGEELGLLGSEHWAQHPTVPLGEVRANLNLDMVGRAGAAKLQVLGAGTSPEFASWMDDAGERAGLELVVSTQGGALGGSSDHQTFLKRGIPALHLFSGLHSDYHKPSDDADKFEAEGAGRVALLGVDLLERLARAQELAFVESKLDPQRQGEVKTGFRTRFGAVPSYTFEGKGVLLDGTSPGSPAERAGFLRGDVLVQLGDIAIGNVYDLTYALQHYKPGDVVRARYERDGQVLEAMVTLSSRELQ